MLLLWFALRVIIVCVCLLFLFSVCGVFVCVRKALAALCLYVRGFLHVCVCVCWGRRLFYLCGVSEMLFLSSLPLLCFCFFVCVWGRVVLFMCFCLSVFVVVDCCVLIICVAFVGVSYLCLSVVYYCSAWCSFVRVKK